jgi:hypothetical protein
MEKIRGLPMESTRFDHEWTNVDVKEMCVHLAAALCLAAALGMGGAQLIGDSSHPAPAVTSSPVASSPGA